MFKNRLNLRNVVKKVTILAVSFTFVPAILAQKPNLKLAEGEILYRGITKLEKCDSVVVSFVLSADKKTAKEYYFQVYGIYIQTSNGTLQKIDNTVSGGGTAEVKTGGMVYEDWETPPNWRITVKQGLGGDTVKGEVNLVYLYRQTNPITRINLGTTPIEFKRVQTKQE